MNDGLKAQCTAGDRASTHEPQSVRRQWHTDPSKLTRSLCAQSILVNVAPKKPNWDLRRDVEKKLAKLERRTQRALIQIMQAEQAAKLQAEGGIQD